MNRFRKLLWMIFIFWIVFFIICDEKWYKIWFENNQIIFNKTEEKEPSQIDKSTNNQVKLSTVSKYKNSDIISINPEFQNPKSLYKSDGIDTEYLAMREQQEKLKREKIKQQENTYSWSNVVTLSDNNTIYSVFQWNDNSENTGTVNQETKKDTWITKVKSSEDAETLKQEIKNSTWTTKKETKQSTWTSNSQVWKETKDEVNKPIIYYPVKKYKYKTHQLNLSKWVAIEISTIRVEKYPMKDDLAINLTKAKDEENTILYKNSDIIRIYSWFENPLILRSSSGIDEKFLIEQKNNKPTIISLEDTDTITSTLENYSDDSKDELTDADLIGGSSTSSDLQEVISSNNESQLNNTGEKISVTNQSKYYDKLKTKIVKNNEKEIADDWAITGEILDEWEIKDLNTEEIVTYRVNKYKLRTYSLNMKKAAEKITISLNIENLPDEDNQNEEDIVISNKPELSNQTTDKAEWNQMKSALVKIKKYQFIKHPFVLKKWIVNNNFAQENIGINDSENWLSNEMLQNLLENEEIDIDTLESESDEILQKVFEQTRDTEVMNLIVETYLNEYQFVNAKRFIENLPDIYRDELKPSLNLRVAFNSFSLSSKDVWENLTILVQDYTSKNIISDDDKNRYLWVIALIDRKYDKFFEIAAWFTSEKNKAFASKIQWYKDQIGKQMWMPEYYFDTLVSLELFNQGLFQPAKVLALYSLQKNTNYILPYQVLAYANFLTNSRDTSTEYLKKLVDLDPNNAEKYRFLMWVAYYWDEKYEQSVVMLSMIKNDNLRLDTQRYLINDYIKLNQKSKMISSWNKLLWYENLVASDYYTYFYEAFYHPYAEWKQYQIYTSDTDLANKMLRSCSVTLQNEEKAVCVYGTIGRNIAMWQFDGLEQYLLDLATKYPQWYLYQALWDYYIQQWDLEKAKAYLIKAISLTQKRSERSQIKKLLQDTM